MVDQDLIEAVKHRDRKAFKQLYANSIRYVYSIVSRYVVNESDHKDVIQEIFARVFLKIASYDSAKGDFKFWLRRITINQCIELHRRKKKSIKVVPMYSITEKETSNDDKYDRLSREEVVAYLRKMPQGYKSIFMLVVIDDYTHKEVAQMLDISAETSRSQLHRAKKWLRENLTSDDLKQIANGL